MVGVIKLYLLRSRDYGDIVLRVRLRNPIVVMQAVLKESGSGARSFAYEAGSAQAFVFKAASTFAMSVVFLAATMRGESEETMYSIVDCGPLMKTNAANLLSTASRIAPLPAFQLCPT